MKSLWIRLIAITAFLPMAQGAFAYSYECSGYINSRSFPDSLSGNYWIGVDSSACGNVTSGVVYINNRPYYMSCNNICDAGGVSCTERDASYRYSVSVEPLSRTMDISVLDTSGNSYPVGTLHCRW